MTTAVHPYIESLLTGTRELATSPQPWLNERRSAALERANALSVPTTRDEDWRFTDLTPLTRLEFRVPQAPHAVAPKLIAPYGVPEAGAKLVFVDGTFAPELSDVGNEGSCVRVLRLSDALRDHGSAIERYLANLVRFDDNVFAALNTAHLRDGAVVLIEKNAVCDKPIHLLHLAREAEAAIYPRTLVIVEPGARCTIVEEHEALTDAAYLTNAVTEIALALTAQLAHVRVQRESVRAFHIANCAVSVGKDATYRSQSIALGARLSRLELSVALEGEGAAAEMDGLAFISGRQLADTHTLIDHSRPNGRSTQLHKTIVGGGAHAVFNGKIFVRPGAQLTDSSQQSRNLLLSDKATVDTKPQLEIFADDVKCAHGATVGQLDADQLFYLRSRGLPETTARDLLTYAFGASVIERIPVRSLVERIESIVMAQTGAVH